MPRLIDAMWELTWTPAQRLCYQPQYVEPAVGDYDPRSGFAGFDAQRHEMHRMPIYAADNVAAYFYMTAMRDTGFRPTHFPALALVHDEFFIEFQRPSFGYETPLAVLAGQLPQRWGWHVKSLPLDDYIRVTTTTPHPDAQTAFIAFLWLSADGKALFVPLAVAGVQLAADNTPVGNSALGLAFQHDPAKLKEPKALSAYFASLFLPAAMTLAFLACKSTKVHTVEPEPKIQKARQRRKKRLLASYQELDIKPMADILRFQGQAGIAGLATALKSCRHHFVQDLQGQSPTILLR